LATEQTTLKVMADYESFPTWTTSRTSTENVDPDDLPISRGLVVDLLRWAQEYDDTLNREDPIASGFASDEEEATFYECGEALARRLAGELSGKYVVEYFDGRVGRVSSISS
jgi:hypothetical protein